MILFQQINTLQWRDSQWFLILACSCSKGDIHHIHYHRLHHRNGAEEHSRDPRSNDQHYILHNIVPWAIAGIVVLVAISSSKWGETKSEICLWMIEWNTREWHKLVLCTFVCTMYYCVLSLDQQTKTKYIYSKMFFWWCWSRPEPSYIVGSYKHDYHEEYFVFILWNTEILNIVIKCLNERFF